jgi:hypothetical protein
VSVLEMPALKPEIALTDFEPAVQNAILEAFPGIEIKGCFFHFKDAPSCIPHALNVL